ncbi:sulfide/dihydroorotate dehydrogenase-like FAD/NAD-binding protein [Mariniplasma anaerobium]|uniref:Ferredoxin-NADP+ reductase subunit alpha n=1 Tax=Mariniplasma anaerobium TaxID=2735436 RepID=A0A7U9THB3_9MOLU|nr:sulfide/dihydroorotate dehydrogenase-like FAD/NAD-binding protein [Mariniplasma anaerobium]BCR36278.1 ferredoxin-NADP+ reductase subunit alpha [Mariniplasma anaerobium]
MNKIISKKVLSKSVTEMKIYAPQILKHAQAGQFVMLRINEKSERIPLTISDMDHENGLLTIIFQVIGSTTYELNELNVGDDILDLVGPLGKPTHIEGFKKVCVIGGGVGCAIAYPVAKALSLKNVEVDVIIGFKSKNDMILHQKFEKIANHVFVSTDDGSYQTKGFVTDILSDLLKNGQTYDHVFAIGPIIMMKMVSQLTAKYNIGTTVSLNPIMVDGTGMCGGCRVKVGKDIKFACVDGPDFDGHLVDFDLLQSRNNMYKETETKNYKCLAEKGGHS